MRTRRRMLMESISRRKASAWSAPSSPARAMKARMSLGRQPPPKPRPALRKRRPIRASYPIASASCVDVRAAGLAHLGHGVDERDLGRQKGIRRGLDQLGGRVVGHDLRHAVRRAVPRTPRRAGPGRARRSSLRAAARRRCGRGAACPATAKPSRRNSGFHASIAPGAGLATASASRAGRADRHRGLADDQVAGSDVREQCAHRRIDVGHVGRVLAALLRRADADEVHLLAARPRRSRW